MAWYYRLLRVYNYVWCHHGPITVVVFEIGHSNSHSSKQTQIENEFVSCNENCLSEDLSRLSKLSGLNWVEIWAAFIQSALNHLSTTFLHKCAILKLLNHRALYPDLIISKNVKRAKSFPSHMAHRAALISISLALSQTPAYTARPRIRG